MKKNTMDRLALCAAMQIVLQNIDRKETQFGTKSMEFATLILDLGADGFVRTLSDDLNGNMKTAPRILVAEKGAPLRYTCLASYIFQEPAFTEQRLDKAESSIRSQENIFRITDVEEFKKAISSALHLASCFEASGRIEASEALTNVVLETCRKRLDEGDPGIAGVLNALGGTYLKQGKLPKAEPLLAEALKTCERTGQAMAAHGPAVLMNLHTIFMARGEHETAQEHLSRAHKAAASGPYTIDYGYLLEVLVNLARFYNALSMNKDEEQVLRDIRRLTVKILKSDPWFIVTYVSPPNELRDSDIFVEFLSNLDTVIQEVNRNTCFGILRLYFDLLRNEPFPPTSGDKDKLPDFFLPD